MVITALIEHNETGIRRIEIQLQVHIIYLLFKIFICIYHIFF